MMAGDRQATEGQPRCPPPDRKVFQADKFSAVAIAGIAGIAIEMVRLFQVDLEHYEKIEGDRLAGGSGLLPGPSGRSQFPMAFQGLHRRPDFRRLRRAGGGGRALQLGVVGGRYEENNFGSTGSGARLAKSYLRTVYRDGPQR